LTAGEIANLATVWVRVAFPGWRIDKRIRGREKARPPLEATGLATS
jgi:hypothetical protein